MSSSSEFKNRVLCYEHRHTNNQRNTLLGFFERRKNITTSIEHRAGRDKFVKQHAINTQVKFVITKMKTTTFPFGILASVILAFIFISCDSSTKDHHRNDQGNNEHASSTGAQISFGEVSGSCYEGIDDFINLRNSHQTIYYSSCGYMMINGKKERLQGSLGHSSYRLSNSNWKIKIDFNETIRGAALGDINRKGVMEIQNRKTGASKEFLVEASLND